MTKLKNTKKGMAKKALSISLVAAMLATSNVPVWAAEFSDGTEAVEDIFTTETETPVEDVAPVVDDAAAEEVVDDAVTLSTGVAESKNYIFDDIQVDASKVNSTWKDISMIKDYFKAGSVIKDDHGNPADVDELRYAFKYGDTWDGTNIDANTFNNSDLSIASGYNGVNLKANAGKSFSMLILQWNHETQNYDIVKEISFGTIKKVDLSDIATVTVGTATYDGTEKKVKPSAISFTTETDLVSLDVNSFNWTFSTDADYVNAGSKITATGTLKTAIPGYTDTVTVPAYTIAKRSLDSSDVIVKVKNPGKDFTFENNSTTEIDKSEVDVFLKNFDSKVTGNVASSISLNDYVKKVTIDTTSIGGKSISVEFDSDALKASSNFTNTAPAGVNSSANKETDTTTDKTVVDVVALNLTDCTVSLKSPIKVDSNSTNVLKAIDVVIKKGDTTLNLTKDTNYTVSLKSGDYSSTGTFSNVITVTGKNNVTGSVTIDLVTVKQAFNANARFEFGTSYLTTNTANVQNLTEGLAYNNGNAVVFKDELGRFSPDGGNSYGDQDNFQITYSNNVNATYGTSVAKLTVTAIAGDYKGCSKDFYFKINPSKVVLSNNKTTNTVTTNATSSIQGVTLNESYADASQYAEAIGLKITGTNGETDSKKKITSEAGINDYKVEYSFVKSNNHAATGENIVGDQIKVVATLKENGNFNADQTNSKTVNGVAGKIDNIAKTNGVITLYVPILEKSIENLDITLKEDTFTYTGEVIKPEVVVKENGKTLKDVATIVGIDDGVNAGTATVKIQVTGYTGTKELKATINPAKLSDVVFAVKKAYIDDKTFTYNGKQQKPTIAQDDDPATTKNEAVSENAAQAEVKLGDVVLSKLFDITYGTNINAGEKAGSVTLTPKALYAKNFEGTSLTATFDIERAVLTGTSNTTITLKDATGKKVTVSSKFVTNPLDNLKWTGEVAKFGSAEVDSKKISVAPAGVKFDDDDYELVYVNAKDATTDSAKAYVAVIGKGNFKGSYSIVEDSRGVVEVKLTADVESENKKNPGTYTILQKDVIEDSEIGYEIEGRYFNSKTVSVANGTYAGGLTVKPVITIKDPETGKVLVEGTDYEINLWVDASKAIEASTTPIKFDINGIGQYKGSGIDKDSTGKQLSYIIEKKALKDCFVSVTKNADKLELTVMNGNVVEKTENFEVKDNGDGTATISVVNGGKNYTGSVDVKINDPSQVGDVGQAMISNVQVVGNTAKVILSDSVENAIGYDYVIATEEDYKNGRVDISKNQILTQTNFQYVQKGVYYAYCHAWKRVDGKKVFGDWSNLYRFEVTATTPAQPAITSVKVSGSTVTVTYTKSANATGYDVVLGTAQKKVNGELRPVEYGTLVKKVTNGNTVTATFKNVKKGTYYAGLHAYNRTRVDNKKVFSPWSTPRKVTVK